MISFKAGVEFWHRQDGVLLVPTPAFWRIMEAAEPIWHNNGAPELVVTAIFDGRHTRLSEHWQGNAVDLRTRNLPGGALGQAAHRCVEQLHAELGSGYTVILERDHCHAHHEPGGGKLLVPPIST